MSFHFNQLPCPKPGRLTLADWLFLLLWTVPCSLLVLAFVLTYCKHLLGVR